MAELEDQMKRLAAATEASNQITAQVGPQISKKLDDTSKKIGDLTSQINLINDKNSKMSYAFLFVAFLQVILMVMQFRSAQKLSLTDENFKAAQIQWRIEDDKQFRQLNRPKLINESQVLIGGIQYGYAPLVNYGNLPAKTLLGAWSIISVIDGKGITVSPKNDLGLQEFLASNIQPAEAHNVSFGAEIYDENRNIFLCLVYMYSGDGMDAPQLVKQYFLWNTSVSPKIWVPTPIISSGDLRATQDRLSELEAFLKSKPQYKTLLTS